MLTIASLTDPGLVRPRNEDFYLFSREYRIVIVADGVGGYHHGDVASRIAAESCYALLENEFDDKNKLKGDDPEAILNRAVVFANRKVIEEKVQKPTHRDMGTTLTCIYLDDAFLYYAYVGDSRVYLIDPGAPELRQLTTDHTLAREYLDDELAPGLYRRSSHILTRMIGADGTVNPGTGKYPIKKGDLILSCTDGLSDLVSGDNILETVLEYHRDMDACLQGLLKQVKENGASDNITIVLARYE